VNAYKVEGHRHSAELRQELGHELGLSFLCHLVPVDQGLLATCYASAAGLSGEDVRELYVQAYAEEPFVEVVDAPPRTGDVRHSNRCRVQATLVGERVIAMAAIDNLWKGAAGQAVQDLNLMLGLPETAGLE
jgi:N-acetyl-gamma-glutamyl-phosphate reductase